MSSWIWNLPKRQPSSLCQSCKDTKTTDSNSSQLLKRGCEQGSQDLYHIFRHRVVLIHYNAPYVCRDGKEWTKVFIHWPSTYNYRQKQTHQYWGEPVRVTRWMRIQRTLRSQFSEPNLDQENALGYTQNSRQTSGKLKCRVKETPLALHQPRSPLSDLSDETG